MKLRLVAAATAGAIALAGSMPAARSQPAKPRLEISALSADAALVTGGDVLLKIAAPADLSAQLAVSVNANGRDVTSAFRPGPTPNTWVGLVTGLPVGASTVTADAGARAHPSLAITK
jgi:hypothetical protein